MQFDTKRPQTNGTDHSGNSSALAQYDVFEFLYLFLPIFQTETLQTMRLKWNMDASYAL